jgi:hypothetical protein
VTQQLRASQPDWGHPTTASIMRLPTTSSHPSTTAGSGTGPGWSLAAPVRGSGHQARGGAGLQSGEPYTGQRGRLLSLAVHETTHRETTPAIRATRPR